METTLINPVSTQHTPTWRFWWLLGGVTTLLIIGLYQWLKPRTAPLERVRTQYLADIVALDSATTHLQRALESGKPEAVLQERFRQTRLAWKRVEFLAELYNPETAKAINGPALPEVEEDDGLQKEVAPMGLQVLEEGLFPYDPAGHADLIQEAAILKTTVGRLYKVSEHNPMTDSHVFDALRLEVFRLQSLGITGFDAPIANTSLPETAEALTSLQRHLSFYDVPSHNPALGTQLDGAFTASLMYLARPVAFNDFDRLTFIRQYANPLSSLLLDIQKALNIPVFNDPRLLSASARTLTDPDTFNPNQFVDAIEHQATPDRIALGKQLFYDPILSGNPTRTCATCHQPDRAFTDGEKTSLAIANGKRITRNAPTLYNAAFQAVQFADSRVAFLEDQARDVIENTDEMHGSLPKSVAALKASPTYKQAFAKTYPDGVTDRNVKNAVASYIRSLTALDSRVDKTLRSADPAKTLLTVEEQHGFNVFMGKGKCATCHFYPLFNGTVPPAYQKTESEVLGTPATSDNKRLDTDLGKFNATRINLHRHSFKTPTVRFAAKTAPYMHNGVYRTLEEVVDFYNEGGGTGFGFDLPNQTLPGDKLNLTGSEKKALVAFLKAL